MQQKTDGRFRPTGALLGLAAALVIAAPARAQDADAARRVFGEIGAATHQTRTATLGISLPSSLLDRPLWGTHLSGHWDFYVSHWRGESTTPGASREALTQVAVVPVVRMRFNQGRSPWFVEAGIGFSLMDSPYHTPHKDFSTDFNFADHLAVGLNFGARHQHELTLRMQHVSNAGIDTPNPGEDFIQLRYGVAF